MNLELRSKEQHIAQMQRGLLNMGSPPLQYFDSCSGADVLVADVMHVQYELLIYYVKLFSSNVLCESYEFGCMEVKNRPTHVALKCLSNVALRTLLKLLQITRKVTCDHSRRDILRKSVN